jgi:hypothetical protein
MLQISEASSFESLIERAKKEGAFVDYTAFSDSIVVSSNRLLPVAKIAYAIWGAALSWTLLSVRGAIAYGSVYHRKSVVFGQGLINAYRLESSVARYPRIVFADDVDLSELTGHVRVATDRDGFRYIAPFEPIDVSLAEESLALRGTLRRTVVRALNDSRPDVLAKWRWVIDEFNRRAAEEHAATGEPVDRIDFDQFRAAREEFPGDDFAEFDWPELDED